MSNVRAVRLSEFCHTGTGGTPFRGNLERYYEGGTIPWVKSGELREAVINETEECITEIALKETNVKLVPAGALLLAMYGATVGRLGILGIEATTNQAVCHIIPDPNKADVRYLFHALSNQVPTLIARSVGGAQPNISQGIIRDLELSLPPLGEQRRIAAILDKAEALRGQRRVALAQLDTLTQSIFLDIFGDPATNPREWPVGKIGDLLESASYGTSEKSETTGAYPVLRMNNITRKGGIDLADLKYMDLDAKELDRYLVRKGDVLFNRTNSPELVGKSAIFREARPMAYAGYLIRLRVNRETDPEYLASFLNTGYSKRVLRGMCKSIIGMANINAKEVQGIRIPCPPLSLQHKFAHCIAGMVKFRSMHRDSLAELDVLFSSLQHRAFRGEL